MRTLSLILVLVLPSFGFSQVNYRGRWYSAPVCNGPNCAMCNQIRSGLNAQKAQFVIPAFQSIVKVTESKPTGNPLSETPQEAVDFILEELFLSPGTKVYDLGCGDARVLTTAAELHGCVGVGIDIDPTQVLRAKERVGLLGLTKRIKIVQNNILNYNYPSDALIYIYLPMDVMSELGPRLRSGTRVVSYLHQFPGLKGRIHTLGSHTFYEYLIP